MVVIHHRMPLKRAKFQAGMTVVTDGSDTSIEIRIWTAKELDHVLLKQLSSALEDTLDKVLSEE